MIPIRHAMGAIQLASGDALGAGANRDHSSALVEDRRAREGDGAAGVVVDGGGVAGPGSVRGGVDSVARAADSDGLRANEFRKRAVLTVEVEVSEKSRESRKQAF